MKEFKMNFTEFWVWIINLYSIPNNPEAKASLQKIRENLLYQWLISCLIVGSLAYIVGIITYINQQQFFPLLVITIIYLFLLYITHIKNLPFKFRAISLLGLLWALGTVNLLTEGFNVDAGIVFIALISIATLLFGIRGGMRAMLGSILTVSVSGFFIISGRLSLSTKVPQESILLWLSGGLLMILIGIIVTFSQEALISSLQKNHLEAKALATHADQRAQQLKKALVALAKLDFSQPASVTDKNDPFDALAIGINLLGKELNTAMHSIQENENRLDFLVSSSPAVIYTRHPTDDYGISFISKNVKALLGHTAKEFTRDSGFCRKHIHPLDAERFFSVIQSLSEQDYNQHEYRILHKDNNYRWIRDEMHLIRDQDGNLQEIIGSWFDTTKQKQVEDMVYASLQEKEILLREVYHRVKNNLQVIASLLNIQSHLLGDSEDDQIIKICKNMNQRIMAMALVHENLYQSKDLAKIEFGEYVQTLSNNLVRSYLENPSAVKLKVRVDPVWLGLDTAIPCGLIINELVTNSLKHAFPNQTDTDKHNKINIQLRILKENTYSLTITDNGVGFPDDVDPFNCESLGLQLVNILVDQLNGELKIDHTHGTQFDINFSELKYIER